MAKDKLVGNRLAREKSPYLLQHAQNPVDWYPWGPEAFQKAAKENKLIFLSIGYSTCHWCHVMEHESFENDDVAKLLNENFVAIKVDREERPDVDHIYMTAVQALTGSGGWPLSFFLTPEGKPVTGGTYFPPEDRWGRPGMKTILPKLAAYWKEDASQMKDAANQLTDLLQPNKKDSAKNLSYLELLDSAYKQFQNSFDSENGGFGGAPKFPRSHDLSFLLRYEKRTQNPLALEMTEKTLIEMATGGIYDHLGGGFARYATDAHWLVPHFEKMLYDQAIISKAYLETFQRTHKQFYADVARDIFRYVFRDMTSPEGAFYSAEDADSEGEEGKFYVWRPEEIEKILGSEDGKLFCDFFGVTDQGNFSAEAGSVSGARATSILSVTRSAESFAKEKNFNLAEFQNKLNQMRKKLFDARAKRIPPHKDDKILTSWNALMISSLAYASQVLEDPAYAKRAEKTADFVLTRMQKDKKLLRRFREGESAIPAFQEDYAYFALALLDLYEATFEIRWFEESIRLTNQMNEFFWDPEAGGYFYTQKDGETLIARTKDYYDGATPSGNSMAALLLLRISKMTGDSDFEAKAEQTILSNAAMLERHPVAFPQLLIALDFALGPSREIVLVGNKKDLFFQQALHKLHQTFDPNHVLLYHPVDSKEAEKIEHYADFIKDQKSQNGKTTVYICRNRVCDLPVTDLAGLEKLWKA